MKRMHDLKQLKTQLADFVREESVYYRHRIKIRLVPVSRAFCFTIYSRKKEAFNVATSFTAAVLPPGTPCFECATATGTSKTLKDNTGLGCVTDISFNYVNYTFKVRIPIFGDTMTFEDVTVTGGSSSFSVSDDVVAI